MKRSKEKRMTAILIQKHINNKKSDSQAIRSLFRMRYAINDAKPTENRYYIEFMTEKGRKKFLVEARHYNSIQMDSLGEITFQKDKFISFEFHKKATKKDVEKLGW